MLQPHPAIRCNLKHLPNRRTTSTMVVLREKLREIRNINEIKRPMLLDLLLNDSNLLLNPMICFGLLKQMVKDELWCRLQQLGLSRMVVGWLMGRTELRTIYVVILFHLLSWCVNIAWWERVCK